MDEKNFAVKIFRCCCPARAVLFFESTQCTACGRMVGFFPDLDVLLAFEFDADQQLWFNSAQPEATYRQCANYSEHQVCNWMVPSADPQLWCRAYRCNEVIPDLSLPQNTFYWRKLEAAKRYALYTLLNLNLPFSSQEEAGAQGHGLLFRFMSDKDAGSEFTTPLEGFSPIYTGHEQGAITINLAEADDVARTRARIKLGEGYRTLLGHFRHELGHYYWNVLIEAQPRQLKEFRTIFGDERQDYAAAMENYYAEGAGTDWQNEYLSAYASMHPWEDWAESWAHYMHMIDTLETANAFALSLDNEPLESVLPARRNNSQALGADALIKNWMRLAVAMNALNRSMGLEDAYPFILTDAIRRKLNWISRLIANYRPTATVAAASTGGA